MSKELDAKSEMKREDLTGNSGSGSFLIGVILGGLAGAAAAMLLAPKSGREIRSTLNHQAGSIKEKTVQLMNKSKPAEDNREEVTYIPIGESTKKPTAETVDELAIRKKLEEAKKAFEEEEFKVTH